LLHIFQTEDGSATLINTQLNTTYHSTHGAIQESNHVFIENGLLSLIPFHQQLTILEIGFGTGLNAWLTWEQTKLYPALNVNYTGIEPYPISNELWSNLNYAPSSLHADFCKLHELTREAVQLSSRFNARVIHELFEHTHIQKRPHLIYYDAFGPDDQPELWSEACLSKCAELLLPGGVWVSYCAKGDVRRSLQTSGLIVERLPGPPGKRHILRAVKPIDTR
jgi:tRNA U34 5-methylaminomethyl-2-thiouridine-forming methyltransferase MnmC